MGVVFLVSGGLSLVALAWFGAKCLKSRPPEAGKAATLGNFLLLLVPMFFLAEAATNVLGLILAISGFSGALTGEVPIYSLATPLFWIVGMALSAWLTELDPILPGLPESLTRARLALALPLALLGLFLLLLAFPLIDVALYAYRLNDLLPGVTDDRLFPEIFRLFASSAWWAFLLLYLGIRLLLAEHPEWGMARLIPIGLLFALPYLYLGHLAAIDIAQDFFLEMGFYTFAHRHAAPVAALLLAGAGGLVLVSSKTGRRSTA